MDELTEIQAEALKSSIQEKLRQFYTDLDDIFKAYNVAGLNNNEHKLLSSFQKDENLEDKKEVKDDEQNNWEMKILLTSKDQTERLPKCEVVSLIPFVIECS